LSTIHAASRRDSLKDTALGMVSTLSFPAIVGTADMMLKSAGVHLVGYEKLVVVIVQQLSEVALLMSAWLWKLVCKRLNSLDSWFLVW